MEEQKRPSRGYRGRVQKKGDTEAVNIEKKQKPNPTQVVIDDLSMTRESLLVILDLKEEIDRELKNRKQDNVLKNLQKKVNTFVKAKHMVKFGSIGDKYNPKNHEAMLYMKSEIQAQGQLMEIRSPGIKSGRKILYRCKAIVSK